jgi:hypothetical protein
MKRFVVLLLALVMAVTGLFASPLWNGTTAGMSFEEVKELFPDIELEYEDEDMQLAKIPFESYLEDNDLIDSGALFFIEDKLIAVQIWISSFEEVRSPLMIAKYGPYDDYFSYVDFSTGYTSENWIWIKEKTLIQLKYSFSPNSKNSDYARITYYDIDSINTSYPGIEWL